MCTPVIWFGPVSILNKSNLWQFLRSIAQSVALRVLPCNSMGYSDNQRDVLLRSDPHRISLPGLDTKTLISQKLHLKHFCPNASYNHLRWWLEWLWMIKLQASCVWVSGNAGWFWEGSKCVHFNIQLNKDWMMSLIIKWIHLPDWCQ